MKVWISAKTFEQKVSEKSQSDSSISGSNKSDTFGETSFGPYLKISSHQNVNESAKN